MAISSSHNYQDGNTEPELSGMFGAKLTTTNGIVDGDCLVADAAGDAKSNNTRGIEKVKEKALIRILQAHGPCDLEAYRCLFLTFVLFTTTLSLLHFRCSWWTVVLHSFSLGTIPIFPGRCVVGILPCPPLVSGNSKMGPSNDDACGTWLGNNEGWAFCWVVGRDNWPSPVSSAASMQLSVSRTA
ncbi:hypothetical protein CYMTET_5190 [Cymbomonas tetramitiformis]|uniref:Uncharacterized protein n=1 Tax=Cymbomonas tetramitiformis TaxID=36881 RepID=A0AAE0LJ54_9CHLO|nr:hypothetical protein CYMTET_5190 [Cymbomonas tetramitiformis]